MAVIVNNTNQQLSIDPQRPVVKVQYDGSQTLVVNPDDPNCCTTLKLIREVSRVDVSGVTVQQVRIELSPTQLLVGQGPALAPEMVLDDLTDVDAAAPNVDDVLIFDGAQWSSTTPPFLTPEQHQSLRQLIHFIEDGPATGFASGAYREILPAGHPFPTLVIWWESPAKLRKIVEKEYEFGSSYAQIVRTTWRMYDADGSTVIATVEDTVTYQGDTPFELNRSRSIS